MSPYLHKHVFGDGKPLVLIHGWAMHSSVWRDFAKMLANDMRIIAIDLPGHGRSDAVHPYDLDQVVDTVLGAVDEPVFSVLGWSLGATVALAIAERTPDRLERVFVLAGNPCFVQSADWPGINAQTLDGFAELLQRDVEQTLIRFLALQVNGLAHGKALLQTLKQAVHEQPAPPAAVLQAGLNILKTTDLRETVLRTDVPLHWILGGRDTLIPVETGERLRRLKPSLTLDVLPDAGHAPFLSHTADLRTLITARF